MNERKTLVKICGLFRNDDIGFVNQVLPDYVGFVFADSKRKISHEQAEIFRKSLDKCIKTVGVFVNSPIRDIKYLCEKGIIDIIQLHGDEDDSYIEIVKAFKKPVIKAFCVGESPDFDKINNSTADFVLLDKHSQRARGGLGEVFDWSVLQHIRREYFLAGGVNLDNIEQALSIQPYAVDISSGAEENGVKNLELMDRLVKKNRNFTYSERDLV